MSALKMQESIPDNEVTELRKQATHKDNRYATLENELLKKNNELSAAKMTFDDALYKLRNEADRALKLESDLNRRSEDLRAERLNRQNLEASLKSASDRLKSEELTSKHLQMELENYASHTASQHQAELRRLQHEKTTLESRLRAMEAQSQAQAQANKPSQLPTRLPRPMTLSGAASTVSDARIATLESELSRAERELADTARLLATAQQDAAKVPRLQSDLIVAENARMRAERAMSMEKTNAESTREALKEREEELEYWRSTAGEQSAIEGKLEDMVKERDEAVQNAEEARRREAVMRNKMEEMEEKEAGLVMEREEALDALHLLQAQSHSSSSTETLADLRAALGERDAALSNARGYATELQQMYRDTLQACEDAEARVRTLEDAKAQPLIIVSPPPSPAARPFIPHTRMSPEDEAIVARLLTAIERLRGERDALRRDLHFARVEHSVANDTLQGRLEAAESELHKFKETAATHVTGASCVTETEIRRLTDELDDWQHEVGELSDELADRATALEACGAELKKLREKVGQVEDREAMMATSHEKGVRNTVTALIVVQHLRSELEEAEETIRGLAQTCDELAKARDQAHTRLSEATQARDTAQQTELTTSDVRLSNALQALEDRDVQLAQTRDELAVARDQADARLSQAIQTRDTSLVTQDTLREELAINGARLSEALQAAEERAAQIADTRCQLSDLQSECSALQRDLADTRAELRAAEARHSEQQLSALSSADGGAAAALKSQLEVLELRVLRRTEQIGMQQHDIKRLETNLRVAEDTIGELTAELETLGRERECLLEDCGQAREARDDAHRRVEALEVEVEMFVRDHDELREVKQALQDAQTVERANSERIEALVHLVAESAGRSKALGAELALKAPQLAAIEANFHAAEANYARTHAEVERLTSELESTAAGLRQRTDDVDTITRELSLAKDETQRLSISFESFKNDVQCREEDASGQTHKLTATIEELECQLLAAQASEDALSQELEATRQSEMELREQLQNVQEQSRAAAAEATKLSTTIASLELTLEAEQTSHSEAFAQAHQEFARRRAEFEAQIAESQRQNATLDATLAEVVQDFTAKNKELESRLEEASVRATTCESLEVELRRLKVEHADDTLVLRSQLEESAGQIDSLQAQLQEATEAITEFESDIKTSVQRYEAAQVEIRGLEHALAATRAQLDEHDASIQALQRDKTVLQAEHTQLEAELERTVTKYQYVEQQAKRSDHDIVRLKSEVERLRAEAAKYDEAAQTAEIGLSFKTVQFEQKLAMMQRELKRQQEHRQCQESIAEYKEKNEYLEEMLRMKSVEIEENDDRFIDALKEKKRLNSKVDSLTRKVQSLQIKLAAAASTSTGPPPNTPGGLPVSRPKTPSPPVLPLMPSAGPSTRPPTRIPSSPAAALRAKTPEPLRRSFISRFATPEPSVPVLPQLFRVETPEPIPAPRPASRVDRHRVPPTSHMTPPPGPSTPGSSGSRKRRAPDDFDSPAPLPVQAIVAPSGNLTPLRHVRRPSNETRSGFTPTRNGNSAPTRPQPSPLRRVTAPLAESTNSPKGSRTLGLGKPAAVSKPPMRSWLSRARAPTVGGVDVRSSSAMGV